MSVVPCTLHNTSGVGGHLESSVASMGVDAGLHTVVHGIDQSPGQVTR